MHPVQNFVLIEAVIHNTILVGEPPEIFSLVASPLGNESHATFAVDLRYLGLPEGALHSGDSIRIIGELYLNRADPLHVVAHSVTKLEADE
jgi:hypothetical protein